MNRKGIPLKEKPPARDGFSLHLWHHPENGYHQTHHFGIEKQDHAEAIHSPLFAGNRNRQVAQGGFTALDSVSLIAGVFRDAVSEAEDSRKERV